MKYNKRQHKKQLKKYLANKFGTKGKDLNAMYKGLKSSNSSGSTVTTISLSLNILFNYISGINNLL